ncbi:PepSY-associated TM helix domain-containing protein [Pontibacter harenae]|uniref:PepSY-associated TM helix domain-containing protein n=1 Tax=Pontibacter harenae TaxID=2894083 RepID=UPI001E5C6FE1|nr:PepSY-associated TM helix domain-containing protein [Pontibacter harenae]MCC9166460.1 PepSY domain-containing protein [Pontibacter harenae]
MNNKYSLRKFFNDVHLWLGIASGLVLFVVCLSGTIYTFHTEIEELLEPSKYTVEIPANATPLAPDALVKTLETDLGGKVAYLAIPEDAARAYQVGVKPAEQGGGKPEGGHGGATEARAEGAKTAGAAKGPQAAQGGHGGGSSGGRPKTYMVNPYTGAVLGTTDGPATEFFRTMMQLHRWLLIEGGVGKMIVGISTIIFVFLILTGLVLWFPVKLKNWKQGFKVKTSAKWKRVNHDLHNTLGFYSFILLLIMSLTGLCWSFEWYRDGLSAVLGDKVFKGRGEKPLPSATPAANAQTLAVADFIQRANAILPYEGDLRVSLPEDATNAVVVNKNKTGFFALSASDKVQLDQYTGEPLKVDIFSEKSFNVQIASLIKPLHLGEVYGMFSKILYFIACLIATSLPVTGTLIWINKLRKKPKEKLKARPAAAVNS